MQPILEVHAAVALRARGNYKVVVDDNGVDVYNATFIEVNLDTDMNRFYTVQLLLETAQQRYFVFCHWGRTGDAPEHFKTYDDMLCA